MLQITRLLTALFLLAVGAHAQEVYTQEPAENRNHIFFHPVITGLSLAFKDLPLLLAFTYERDLEGNGNSFVYQPQFAVGIRNVDDVLVSQFSMTNQLGLRKYLNGSHRGLYIQGSGAFGFGFLSAEQKGNPDEASATMTAFGALGYLGYKWSHVFLDIGGGYQVANGTVGFDNGEEVEISASGRAIDFNLGFGF